MRGDLKPYCRAILLAALVLMASISVARASQNALALWGSMDFGITLKAAQTLQREDPYRSYREKPPHNDAVARPERNPFAMVPVQAPSALMLLWPYSGLSWPAAKLAWLISNLAFTAGLLMLAFRRFLPKRPMWIYVAIACLFVMSASWRNVIANGQHLLASLFFFLLAIELADRKRDWWSGLALAAALLKYSVTFFLLPYLIFKRQWLPLVSALALHGAMTAGVALWLGANPVAMLQESVRISSGILTFDGYVDVAALVHLAGGPAWLAVGISLAMTAVVLWLAVRRPNGDAELYFAALCMISLILIYHRRYDFILLIVPWLVALRNWRTKLPIAALVTLAVALIWFGDRLIKAWAPSLHANGSAYHLLVVLVWYGAGAMILAQTFRRGTDEDPSLAGREPSP